MTVGVGNIFSEETSSTRTSLPPAWSPCSAQATARAARKWAGWTVARGDSRSRIIPLTVLLLPTSQLRLLVRLWLLSDFTTAFQRPGKEML